MVSLKYDMVGVTVDVNSLQATRICLIDEPSLPVSLHTKDRYQDEFVFMV